MTIVKAEWLERSDHGHVCSAECWHGQLGAKVWSSPECVRCGCRSFEASDDRRWCLRCGKTQYKVSR